MEGRHNHSCARTSAHARTHKLTHPTSTHTLASVAGRATLENNHATIARVIKAGGDCDVSKMSNFCLIAMWADSELQALAETNERFTELMAEIKTKISQSSKSAGKTTISTARTRHLA